VKGLGREGGESVYADGIEGRRRKCGRYRRIVIQK
jgi:hypothetical protein